MVYWIMNGILHWCNGPNLSSMIWLVLYSKPWVCAVHDKIRSEDTFKEKRVNWIHLAGNDNPIECCTERSTDPSPRHRHPACMPLKVDVADEDFTVLPSCLNYVRSALGVNPDCKFGPAQQVSYIFYVVFVLCILLTADNAGIHSKWKEGLESKYKIDELKMTHVTSIWIYKQSSPLN